MMSSLAELVPRSACIIEISKKHERLAPFVFVHERGISFIDVGWGVGGASSSHQFHIVKGEISGDGPWRVGDVGVRELRPYDDLYSDFIEYDLLATLTSFVTRDNARKALIHSTHNPLRVLGEMLS